MKEQIKEQEFHEKLRCIQTLKDVRLWRLSRLWRYL